jgi:enterochelin esterase-like enzyme
MKRFSLQTSRITFPIALGVFLLLRSILMVCCVLVVYLVYASGNPGMAASFVLSVPGISTDAPESTSLDVVNATPTVNTTVYDDPTPTISPEADVPTATVEATETVLPTETATIQPSPTVQQVLFCPDAPGRIEDITYTARLFPSPLPAKVYLPPCYDQDNQDYPVLYLLSQEGFDENRWVDIGVTEQAEERIQARQLSPFIIVMPQHPDRLFNGTDGGPGSYEVEVVEGLVPYIDENYRTAQSADQRAIAGVSRGGVWAIEISFSNPDLFGGMAAVSPSLDSNYPRVQYDPTNLANAAETLPLNMLFLIAEDDPALPQVQNLSQTLIGLGYIHSFLVESPGQAERLWPEAVTEIFNVLAVGW